MSNTRGICIGLLALVAGAATASADTISFGPYTVASQSADNTFSATLDVRQFDASLGTLTGVQITAEGDFMVGFSITNNTGGLGTFSGATGTGYVDILGPGSLDISLSGDTSGHSGTVANGDHVTFLSSPATGSQIGNPTDLADYIGTATTTTALTFLAGGYSATGFGTGGLVYDATGTTGGTVNIVYTYTANAGPSTPEPASWLLMGSSLLVAGFLFRKRLAL